MVEKNNLVLQKDNCDLCIINRNKLSSYICADLIFYFVYVVNGYNVQKHSTFHIHFEII